MPPRSVPDVSICRLLMRFCSVSFALFLFHRCEKALGNTAIDLVSSPAMPASPTNIIAIIHWHLGCQGLLCSSDCLLSGKSEEHSSQNSLTKYASMVHTVYILHLQPGFGCKRSHYMFPATAGASNEVCGTHYFYWTTCNLSFAVLLQEMSSVTYSVWTNSNKQSLI